MLPVAALPNPVVVIDDESEGQAVYLTWELEQPWTSQDLDALALLLPGEPCVHEPTDLAERVAVVSMELTEANEEAAARAALAAVREVLASRGCGGRGTEAIVYVEGASFTADAEMLSGTRIAPRADAPQRTHDRAHANRTRGGHQSGSGSRPGRHPLRTRARTAC
jgi:hypothetical protein